MAGLCSAEFEEKLMSRVRDIAGDLLTEDDLRDLVSNGIQKLFFDPRVEHEGWRKIEHPPLIVHIVEELLREEVEKAVTAYIEEHSDEILDKVREVVQEGVGTAFVKALQSKFSYDLMTFQQNIEARLANSGI